MEWMEIKITLSADDGVKILPRLSDELGFSQRDEDWSVEKRDRDVATLEYAPCPEPPNRKENW